VVWGECIEDRPLRLILRGDADAGILLSVVGFEGEFVGDEFEVGDAAAASESSCSTSRFFSSSIAFSNLSLSKLITPRVQCNTPTGRIAFGWM
jgi:hypothetical protein